MIKQISVELCGFLFVCGAEDSLNSPAGVPETFPNFAELARQPGKRSTFQQLYELKSELVK